MFLTSIIKELKSYFYFSRIEFGFMRETTYYANDIDEDVDIVWLK